MDPTNPEKRAADDLQPVADALHRQRPALDALALDRIKLRAMNGARRHASSRTKGVPMRTRLVTLLTAAFLMIGTGGALAWVGGEHFGFDSGGGSGSASFNQYRECDHGNGQGKDHECHGHEGEPPGKSGEPPPGKGGPPRGLGGENGNGHGH